MKRDCQGYYLYKKAFFSPNKSLSAFIIIFSPKSIFGCFWRLIAQKPGNETRAMRAVMEGGVGEGWVAKAQSMGLSTPRQQRTRDQNRN